MSLADQIAGLEFDLTDAREQVDKLADELHESRSYTSDLERDLEQANAFIDYVDEAHPELRTAFEAAKKLKGEKSEYRHLHTT